MKSHYPNQWWPWWRHQMETFSALLALCAGNSPVPVNSPHKGQWRGALMFSLIYAWINDWVNNREAGDLRRQRGHYGVIVMLSLLTHFILTHWGRMIHICVSNLTIIVSHKDLLSVPSHYLSTCWNILNWTLTNKLQWNSYIFIQENSFENIVCEMVDILPQPPWVNNHGWWNFDNEITWIQLVH